MHIILQVCLPCCLSVFVKLGCHIVEWWTIDSGPLKQDNSFCDEQLQICKNGHLSLVLIYLAQKCQAQNNHKYIATLTMVFNAFQIVLNIKVLTLTMLLNINSLNNLTVLLLPVPLGGAPTNVLQTHPELSTAYLIKMRSDPSDFRCCKFSPEYIYIYTLS